MSSVWPDCMVHMRRGLWRSCTIYSRRCCIAPLCTSWWASAAVPVSDSIFNLHVLLLFNRNLLLILSKTYLHRLICNFWVCTESFFWFAFFMFATLQYCTMYGIMAVAVTPNLMMAAVLSSAFFSMWNLFAGFIIPKPVCCLPSC